MHASGFYWDRMWEGTKRPETLEVTLNRGLYVELFKLALQFRGLGKPIRVTEIR